MKRSVTVKETSPNHFFSAATARVTARDFRERLRSDTEGTVTPAYVQEYKKERDAGNR